MVVTLSSDDGNAYRPKNVCTISLAELADGLEEAGFSAQLTGPATAAQQANIQGVMLDSRVVATGDLYIGLPGASYHGAAYAPNAFQAGAVALLTDEAGLVLVSQLMGLGETSHEQQAQLPVPVLVVTKVRETIGTVARLIYRTHNQPCLYGVTGTNGKTTTTYLLEAALKATGETTGLIGTVETRIKDSVVPSRFTTPEAPQLHGLMARMREDQVSATAMEVSSHALDYHRVSGLRFGVSGFTNLTQDHLDLHGSMQAYATTKAKLFGPDYSEKSVITLNGGPDMEWGMFMVEAARAAGTEDSNLITLDIGPAAVCTATHNTQREALETADWKISQTAPTGIGSRFTLDHRDGLTVHIRVRLPGDFNISNAALAAVMVFEGADPQRWAEIAEIFDAPEGTGPFETATVPGRMEVIATEPTVIVDFAHNPDGLVQALEATRQIHAGHHNSGRTILVFGATGNRDTTKRATMGQIAVDGADVVIVTDDDPHSEDPDQIRDMVLHGAYVAQSSHEQAGREVEIYESAPRAEALELAVRIARPEDVILAAGRGHETAQDVNGVRVELDDRDALRSALESHGYITNSVEARFVSPSPTEKE